MVGTLIGILRLRENSATNTSGYFSYEASIYSSVDVSHQLLIHVHVKKSSGPLGDYFTARVIGEIDYSPTSGYVVYADSVKVVQDDSQLNHMDLEPTIIFTGTIHRTLPLDGRIIIEVSKQRASDWMIGCDFHDYDGLIPSTLARGDTIHLVSQFTQETRNTDGRTPLLVVCPYLISPIVPYGPNIVYRPVERQCTSVSPKPSVHRHDASTPPPPANRQLVQGSSTPSLEPVPDLSSASPDVPPAPPVAEPAVKPARPNDKKRAKNDTGLPECGQSEGVSLRPMKRARTARMSVAEKPPRRSARQARRSAAL